MIPLNQHPSHLDPSARLVSGFGARWEVFQVTGGFVGCAEGMAAPGLFAKKEDAEAAARQIAGRHVAEVF